MYIIITISLKIHNIAYFKVETMPKRGMTVLYNQLDYKNLLHKEDLTEVNQFIFYMVTVKNSVGALQIVKTTKV